MMKNATFLAMLFAAGCSSGQDAGEELNQGRQALEKSRYQKAIAHFDRAIESTPDSAEAYRGRARARFNAGQFKPAREDCDKALELAAGNADTLALRGRVLLKLEQVDAALADFDKAISQDAANREARTWRAGIYLNRRQYAKAVGDCDIALKNLNDPARRRKYSQAYLYRALALFELGEHGRAESDALLASAFRADMRGRDVPCLRRPSKRFSFRDPKGGLRANVKHVAEYKLKPITHARIVFRNHTKMVQAVKFSPDGGFLASGGNDGLVTIRKVPSFNVAAGRRIPGYAVFDLAFSPDGKYLAAALVGSRTAVIGRNRARQTFIRIWKADKWSHVRDVPGRYTFVNHFTFSPDGRHLAAAYSYFRTSSRRVNEVSIWDIDRGKELKRIEPGGGFVNSLAFTPDARLIIGRGRVTSRSGQAVTTSGAAELWNPITGKKITSFDEKSGAVSAIGFLDDGRKLVTGSRGGLVKIWNMRTKEVLLDEATQTSWVSGLAISPDGRRIASSGGKTVHVLDIPTGDMVTLLGNPSSRAGVPTHTDIVESVSWSPDGRFIASSSRDKTVRIWNAPPPAAAELPRIDRFQSVKYPGIIKQARYSPDGTMIAIAGTARTIVLLSAKDGRTLATLRGHTSEIYDVSFSTDGRRLASASGGYWNPDKKGELKIWDVAKRQLIADLTGFEGPVPNVDYSPDGKLLASCHWDKTSDIRIWDAATHKPLGILRGHITPHGAAFSRNGKAIASIDWTHVRVWNLAGDAIGKHKNNLAADVSYPGVCGVDFSPDGKTIALTCQKAGEPTVALVDRAQHRIVQRVQGKRCLYSPDGRWLATWFIDRIHLYDCHNRNRLAYALHKPADAQIDRFAFSPDVKTLIAGSTNGRVLAWDISQAK